MSLVPDRARPTPSRAAIAFSSGAIGGLCVGLAVPLLAAAGFMELLGVAIHPQLTPPFVYQKVVWGGLWGFILLIPFNASALARGTLFGALGPGLAQLLIVFPLKETPGSIAGLSLGPLTPLLVLFLNAFVWGVPSALAYSLLRPPSPQSFYQSSRRE
ncbi:hypothetical protein CLOM_g3121 [Closterium sp. NIES-68]|nr:hypothetical protein CLOM_g2541 [Closterium sp. NIES-68]GJP43686.1 hypothetical protein CLOM_g3121 [Closterium sp. NIES-68]GJP74255.1 hypothetical protein CLOP_g4869 [Closterium sp. NIES-67]GJP79970.1 hypothetical protein CLOP_g10198 [Closterium sp. NIES-67]